MNSNNPHNLILAALLSGVKVKRPVRRDLGMTLEDIKNAVRAGCMVHWVNSAYVVTRAKFPDGIEDFSIVCTHNQNCIGLTWRDGVTMNGDPSQFYLAPVFPA